MARRLRAAKWMIVLIATMWTVGMPTAHAAVAVEIGLSDLVNRATSVVVGTPIEAQSMWEQGEGRFRIVTYHRVAIERVVAGKLEGAETWVRVLGGRVGDIGQRVEGEAVLPMGKRQLLFLSPRPEGGSRVVGMAQGAWLIVRGTDGVDRIRPGAQRGMLVANRERSSATAELTGRSLEEALVQVARVRATHAP